MNGWAYYKTITISDTNVDEDLTNFPLLVTIDSDLDIGSHARSDGYDIRFTLDDGKTELAFERESFNISSGEASGKFWVRIPTILASGGATIRCYYGNSDAADSSNPTFVWQNTPYLLVTHGKDGATSGKLAAAFGPEGTKKAAGEPNEQSNGIVEECQAFDGGSGDDDYVDFGTSVQPDAWIAEAWVKITANHPCALWQWDPSTSICGCTLYHGFGSKPITQLSSSCWKYWPASAWAAISDGNWHHVVFTIPGSDQADIHNARMFVDGVEQVPDAVSDTSAQQVKSNLRLGYYIYSGTQYSIPGQVDEARIGDYSQFNSENEAAAWIKFTYANIMNAGNELSWDSEEYKSGNNLVRFWLMKLI